MNLTVPGCNYRCSFCPYSELIHDYIPMEKTGNQDFIDILRPRLGFLDGVSMVGGEPLLHRELAGFLRDLRFNGSQVKIKTNASKPKETQYIIDHKLIDYISVFIPAPPSKYKEIVNQRIDLKDVLKTIQIIRKSNIEHDFTIMPVRGVHEQQDLLEIARLLAGSRRLVIQRFRSCSTLNPELGSSEPFSGEELSKLREILLPYFAEVVVSSSYY